MRRLAPSIQPLPPPPECPAPIRHPGFRSSCSSLAASTADEKYGVRRWESMGSERASILWSGGDGISRTAQALRRAMNCRAGTAVRISTARPSRPRKATSRAKRIPKVWMREQRGISRPGPARPRSSQASPRSRARMSSATATSIPSARTRGRRRSLAAVERSPIRHQVFVGSHSPPEASLRSIKRRNDPRCGANPRSAPAPRTRRDTMIGMMRTLPRPGMTAEQTRLARG